MKTKKYKEIRSKYVTMTVIDESRVIRVKRGPYKEERRNELESLDDVKKLIENIRDEVVCLHETEAEKIYFTREFFYVDSK